MDANRLAKIAENEKSDASRPPKREEVKHQRAHWMKYRICSHKKKKKEEQEEKKISL